jgi:hypothetical protein
MIDPKVILDKYASMQDSELIHFAMEDGQRLTPEGKRLLEDELARRSLGGNITGIETTSNLNVHHTIRSSHHDRLMTSYALEQKENGKADLDIIAGIMETGIEESIARDIVSSIETNATSGIKKSEMEKLIGSLIFICGLSVIFLPLSPFSNRLIYILAWCAILFGALKYIKGLYYKKRYKKALENIKRDIID